MHVTCACVPAVLRARFLSARSPSCCVAVLNSRRFCNQCALCAQLGQHVSEFRHALSCQVCVSAHVAEFESELMFNAFRLCMCASCVESVSVSCAIVIMRC